jgi:DNA-binding NarL/FixJ family response regulator
MRANRPVQPLGLIKAGQLRPNVIIMDVSMPVMDGIEATRRIKALMPEVSIIGLSMHEDEDISRSMRNAGAAAFMRKTASTAELLKGYL